MKKEITLKIKGDNGVAIENIGDLSSSFFRDTYYDAFYLIEKLIEKNENYVKRSEEQERLYNTITFLGERGSGKTSVMRSFLGMLQNLNLETLKKFLAEYKNKESHAISSECKIEYIDFVCLDCIDASLLEENEDIFVVILAKMLQKYNRIWEGKSDKRNLKARYDILEKFEEIYRKIKNLAKRKSDTYASGESYVQDLKELYGSLDLREAFQEFLPVFLDAVSENLNKSSRYLVIAVDDLDMNKKNGYNMLEQLHRYFMIPQVIICLAVSRREIEALCKEHYTNTYQNKEILSHRYLEKVMPVSQRIYMPEIISREVMLSGDKRIVKEAILRKIARTTHVYYDGCGLKTHFYEVGNLRTLNNLFNMLDRMPETDIAAYKKNFSSYLEILELNITRLRYDVINRMAAEKLNDEQDRIFQSIYESKVTRQGIVCLDWIEKKYRERFKKEFKEDSKEDADYAYGNFLRILHFIRKNVPEYKPLTECILALESIELTWLYENLNYDKNNNGYENILRKLNSCFGMSVGGSIGNKLLPYVDKGKKNVYVGYKVGIRNVKFELKTECGKNLLDSECDEILGELIRTMEMAFQMVVYKNYQNTDLELSIVLPKDEIIVDKKCMDDEFEEVEEEKISVLFEAQELDFDILGFVLNGMNYKSYFVKMKKCF